MDPVVHFEIPAENSDRVSKFYNKVFGWNISQLGPDMGNYVLVSTAKTDQKTNRPTEPGVINGGIYTKSDMQKNDHVSIVLAVKDIHESIKKIVEAGGKIIGEPVKIPMVGWQVYFIDTEGNKNSLLQPEM